MTHRYRDLRDTLGAVAGNIDAKVALEWNSLEPDWVRELPLPARLAYLDSTRVVFRRALAASTDLPPHAWHRLDRDPDRTVRHLAALRPDVPPAVLEQFVRTYADNDPHLPSLVDHPSFPRDRLRSFADESDPRVRRVALKDPSLPVHLLVHLAHDPDVGVRRATASHPGLDPALIDALLADDDTDVVSNTASNPALPATQVQRILADAGL